MFVSRAFVRRLTLLPILYAAIVHVQPPLCRAAAAAPLRRAASSVSRAAARRRMPLLSQALAESDAAAEPSSASALAIKVSMVDSLRRHLRLPAKERKARFFVDPSLSSAEQMYADLMTAVREHWGWLPDDFELHHTAVERELAAGSATAAAAAAAHDHADAHDLLLRTAADLERALAAARALGVAPTFKLVATVPERRGPPARVTVDLADVMADNPVARMVSFYTFKPIADPAALKVELEWRLAAVRALGSVYVAAEGVNGQLMVRADMVAELRAAFDAIGALADVEINMGDEVRADEVTLPFHRFKVTHKAKVLQDGLAEALDLAAAGGSGEEIPAAQWHAELSLPEAQRPLLLDCRNWYESEVGRFDGAWPLNTSKFHESWPKLEEALRDVEPGRRVLTYCTGGIRCVKVGAYLTQKLGLTNVARLEHGIVGYKRWVDEQRAAGEGGAGTGAGAAAEPAESLFRGTNFVFDQRVGVKVTDDRLTDDPILSLIYAKGEGSQPLREAVYHETRKHAENGGEQ